MTTPSELRDDWSTRSVQPQPDPHDVENHKCSLRSPKMWNPMHKLQQSILAILLVLPSTEPLETTSLPLKTASLLKTTPSLKTTPHHCCPYLKVSHTEELHIDAFWYLDNHCSSWNQNVPIAMDMTSGGFMSNPMMGTAAPAGITGNIHQQLLPLISQCRALNPVDPKVPQFLHRSEDYYWQIAILTCSGQVWLRC